MATGTLQKNMVLLWTNPSPNAVFPAQNVPLNLSGYSFVLIRARNSNGSTNYFDTIGYVGEKMNIMRIVLVKTNERFYLGTRAVDISSSGCNFENGMQATSSSATIDSDGVNIPIEIYGIKA